MAAPIGDTELLEAEPEPWGLPVGIRRHPWVAGSVVALVAVAAAAGIVAYRAAQPDPAEAPVVVAVPVDLPDVATAALWSTDTMGRATGPVTLALPSRIDVADPQGRDVNVLGISGPAVAEPPNPVGRTVRDGPTLYRFVIKADCDAVPADAQYGVAVAVRQPTGVIDVLHSAVDASSGWGTQVQLACAGYRAARDVIVTRAVAQVSPTTPELTLDLTLVNSAAGPALLSFQSPEAVEGQAPLTTPLEPGAVALAPGETRTLRFRQLLEPCGAGRRFVDVTSDSLQLVGVRAAIGVDPATDRWAGGVPMSAEAVDAIVTAQAQVCGGVRDVLAITPPGSIVATPDGRRVDVRLTVDVTPGTVRELRVRPTATDGWTVAAGPWLVPDRSGQVRTTLALSGHGHGRCELFPSELQVDLRLRDTARGTVTFVTYLLPQGDRDVRAVGCRPNAAGTS